MRTARDGDRIIIITVIIVIGYRSTISRRPDGRKFRIGMFSPCTAWYFPCTNKEEYVGDHSGTTETGLRRYVRVQTPFRGVIVVARTRVHAKTQRARAYNND